MMKRRIPLWTTLIPLAAAVGLYAHYWSEQRDDFRTELARLFGEGTAIEFGGFPYRIEATVERPQLRHDGPETFAQLAASKLVLNRQPWRPALTIIYATEPRVQLSAPGLRGARLDIEAREALNSLHLAGGRLQRLSTTYEDARLWSGLLPVPLSAPHFEIHLRETPGEADPAGSSPTPPRQAQLVLSGDAVRMGQGDPLKLQADVAFTAEAPVRSLGVLRAGGTAELTRLTLSNDKDRLVVDMNATAVPMADGRLMWSGTVETICPRTLAAAFRGRAAEPEQPARRMVRFAFRGQPGAYELVEPEGGISRVPVRSQEPPCPVLRR